MAYGAPTEIVLLMTTETAPTFRIDNRIGIVTAECVFGMNMFSDFFAAVTNLTGGRSHESQKVFRDARSTVLLELQHEALRMGANAIIGVSVSYDSIKMGNSSNMLFAVAVGTAVIADVGPDWEGRYTPPPEPVRLTEEELGPYGHLSAEQLLATVEYKGFPAEKRKGAMETLLRLHPDAPETSKAQQIKI